jgi:concanavalin A-like lectin/glucanase superfamily protein/neutral/alkaline ceramidase-like enzyme
MRSFWLMFLLVVPFLLPPSEALAEFRVGTSLTDITPEQLPVLVNGGMRSRTADQVKARLNARAIVLDDGRERLAIVVVDTCMMPRPLLDEAKALAARQTKIQPDRMLISATHTHTAPSSMGCLGTDADPNYVPFLRGKLVEAIVSAEENLQPARVGWAVANAEEYTALRRWIRRPDRIVEDPFGNPTVRANMHAGRNWDDVTGESGPEDPDLSLISFQTADGKPIAVLANFSMHYFSDAALSADYFGLFCEGLKAHLAPDTSDGPSPFVGMISHNCSGDIWRRDYTKTEAVNHTIQSYAEGLVKIALEAYETIEYESDVDLAMGETRMKLDYRVPDKQRLEWAEQIVESMGDRLPKDTTEVYAREQVLLHERQSTEIVVQALRIGDIAIGTTPNETYALTGLKLKEQSPLAQTMVIELANGGDGYIPPPEQYLLGGYNTWPARSAGLEIEAEPKIVEAILQLFEQVAGKPRRHFEQSRGPGAAAILAAKPTAYWRLDELAGPRAVDSSAGNCDASYEPAVTYFLEGPRSDVFCCDGETNRCAHFAGDRLRSRVADLRDSYSVSLWFWNGMPVDARPVSGWMFSRGRDHGLGPYGDHLGLGGAENHPGRLVFQHGEAAPLAGRTEVARWTWNHVLLVRDGENVRIYLNGASEPEIETKCPVDFPPGFDRVFFGGRCDGQSNWEGRLDEIAIFDRVLSEEEMKGLAGR